MKPLHEQGYVIVAVNNHVDYVKCARQLATSIKQFDPGAKTALITDHEIELPEFDYTRVFSSQENNNIFALDWQIFHLSPFRETIKIEADCLVVSSIGHWWSRFRHRDMVISTGCKNWLNQPCTSRAYRQTFDSNFLPDVYNALTYWRLSQTAKDFFYLTRDIFLHWSKFKTLLRLPPYQPDTDLVYAMAAHIIGAELVTLPGGPQITHMKKHHALSHGSDWTKEFVWEYHQGHLRINTVAQQGVFHYVIKDWQP